MEALYQTLEKLLSEKSSLYLQLIEILQEERNFISEYSRESLEILLEKKEILVTKIHKVNTQREQLTQTIAEKKQIPEEERTLKAIILLDDNRWSKHMAKHRKTLRQQIQKIQELNSKNKKLIHRSSMAMKRSLTWLYQVDAAYTPYHQNGELRETPLQSGLVNLDV